MHANHATGCPPQVTDDELAERAVLTGAPALELQTLAGTAAGSSPRGLLESVDNALRVLVLLAQGERHSVTGIAEHLGVAPSTAHRVLSTLVYRGFAQQAGDRTYGAGPALVAGRADRRPRNHLVETALPHLRRAAKAVNETTHLAILVNREVRFLLSTESSEALRIGSRVGHVLPAHRTACGKVLLAQLPVEELHALYPAEGIADLGLDASEVTALYRELKIIRGRGYAVNRRQSERGLHALAVAVPEKGARSRAAVTVSVPSLRFGNARVGELLTAVEQAAHGIGTQVDSSVERSASSDAGVA